MRVCQAGEIPPEILLVARARNRRLTRIMAEETENTESAPAAEAAEPAGPTKNKKINKMSLAEIDAAIKKTEQHMTGLTSSYAVALLARKKDLEAAG